MKNRRISFENLWISKGFPYNPSWGWNKAPPKKSLRDIGMAHTANVFMLNIVELVHWAPIIPAFLMAQSILNHSDEWTIYFKMIYREHFYFFFLQLLHFLAVFLVL